MTELLPDPRPDMSSQLAPLRLNPTGVSAGPSPVDVQVMQATSVDAAMAAVAQLYDANGRPNVS